MNPVSREPAADPPSLEKVCIAPLFDGEDPGGQVGEEGILGGGRRSYRKKA